jgi:hypothetical protein
MQLFCLIGDRLLQHRACQPRPGEDRWRVCRIDRDDHQEPDSSRPELQVEKDLTRRVLRSGANGIKLF